MYSDSNWASDTVDRRSITGYISYFGSAPISWSSRKQPTVALSTMEAEYMALAKATCEAIWLRKLSSELGIPTNSPTTIFIDNQSAMRFAENPVFHGCSKHIDIRHHFVRERLASNEVILNHCANEENVADMFTKPLAKPQFIALRVLFVIVFLVLSSRGGVLGISGATTNSTNTSERSFVVMYLFH